ncbi:prolactin regulatory element-binding protein isoform X2 [Lingula anatina]|uniref:Prolactin regulatory element-binding protein isoform X2 n=1 Tax=Lingula anatina TaxID=7574 RepID=A0A1S3IP12_LINAN|nr:prolactin regulatory element-binding protein isoform X2 [Lingula anatina]|eukprot:XP_013399942.1 prolactin regulatory element-binding protein isoform X2 [Lingula anatina]
MAPKKKGLLLGHLEFPPYAVNAVGDRHFIVAGGGGTAKTGVPNAFEIFQLRCDRADVEARSVLKFSDLECAIMNTAVHENEKGFMLAAGMEENCRFYNLKHKVITLEDTEDKHKDTKDSAVRQRKGKQSQPDSKSKEVEKLVSFQVDPFKTIQTDFHGDGGFQKVVQISLDGKILATGGADGFLRIWKLPELKRLQEIEAHEGEIEDLSISPDGNQIVTVSHDKHSSVWNTKDGSKHQELNWKGKSNSAYRFRSCRYGVTKGPKPEVTLYTTHIPVTRAGKHPLPCYITLWDSAKLVAKKSANVGGEVVSAFEVSDDGLYLGLGTINGSIAIYIAFSLQCLHQVREAHSIFITGIEFLPSTSTAQAITFGHDVSLLSVSVDKQIKIHQVPTRGSISAVWVLLGAFIIMCAIFWFLATIGL